LVERGLRSSRAKLTEKGLCLELCEQMHRSGQLLLQRNGQLVGSARGTSNTAVVQGRVQAEVEVLRDAAF